MSTGCRTSSPAAARCIAHPGLALATTVAPERSRARAIGRHLAIADRRRQLRLQRRVRAAGAAAQPLVVELDDVDVAARARSARLVGLLHVAQVARVLHDHRAHGRAAGGGQSSRRRSASHSCTSRTRAANAPRRGGAEQVAVVLHRRAASGRVDEHRRVTGHRRDRPRRQPLRLGLEPGVHVQRAAARRARGRGPRTTRPTASISAAVLRCVDAHPRVHHAAGEQPDIGVGHRPVGDGRGPRRSGSRPNPSRFGTRRSRWATASSVDPASSARWWPSTRNAGPLPPRCDRCAGRRAPPWSAP